MPETSNPAAEKWTGGCRCKKIQFTVTGKPDWPHGCSCPDCKTRGGGPMQWWIGFPLDGLTWTNNVEPTWYDTFPGKTKRGFCPNCGSNLAAFDYGDTTIGINVPALDQQDDPRLVPIAQSFRGDAVAWLPQIVDNQHSTAD
jgi:hypothetical protein